MTELTDTKSFCCRRTLGALILLLAAILPAQAQKLIVRDFKSLPTDQTAMNAETRRIDQNGNRAALIRIYTPLKLTDLTFGGSVNNFVESIQRPGEILLYLPSRSQRVVITHSRYEPVDYWYEEQIEPGRVYSMRLTVEGKEVSFAASTDGADVTVDGDTIGRSPTRAYLSYGPHVVKAQLGTLIYEDRLDVSPKGPDRFDLRMEDENLKYGDVTVTVPNNAEIYFLGRREGVGAASFHLKEGLYPVETRKKDHDNQMTTVTVEAGKSIEVPLAAPRPHIGYLDVITDPVNNVDILSGDTIFSDSKVMQLPVGQYELQFARKGYYTVDRTYDIVRGQTVTDSIHLVRKQYVRPDGLFVGAGFTYSKMPGVNVMLGGRVYGVDIAASYNAGVTRSERVDWYESSTGLFAESCTYRMDEVGIAAGYQISVIERIGITPRVGYMAQIISGNGSKGNMMACHCVTGGVRLAFVPVPRVGIFLDPEYAYGFKASTQFDDIARRGGFEKGGFHITLGVYVNLL